MSAGDVVIRLATVSDQHALDRVMKSAAVAVERGEVLKQLLAVPAYLRVETHLIEKRQVVCAELDDTICGFASFSVHGGYGELEGLFVEPEHWRRGIATLLCAAVQAQLVARHFSDIRVLAGETALPFYKAAGFKITGREKTALGPIAFVMSKKI